MSDRSSFGKQRHLTRTSSAERRDSNISDHRSSPDVTSERPRSSVVQRSRSSVEGLRSGQFSGRKSGTPSPHVRKSSAQEERLQQLMKRLESLDAQTPTSGSDVMRTEPRSTPQQQQQQQQQPARSAPRQFSRENIQNTIENARRWASTEQAPASPPIQQQQQQKHHPLQQPQHQHFQSQPVTMTSSYDGFDRIQDRANATVPENATHGKS